MFQLIAIDYIKGLRTFGFPNIYHTARKVVITPHISNMYNFTYDELIYTYEYFSGNGKKKNAFFAEILSFYNYTTSD